MTVDGQQNPLAGDTASKIPVLKRPYCDILHECTGTFVDCLQPNRALLTYLKEEQVLNPEMVQKILCRPNRADRVTQLFEFLKALGPQSFLSFVHALKHTEQFFLANILAANIVPTCSQAMA